MRRAFSAWSDSVSSVAVSCVSLDDWRGIIVVVGEMEFDLVDDSSTVG